MNQRSTLHPAMYELFPTSVSSRRACMLVLDVSASMHGVPIAQLKDCVQQLLAKLKGDPASAEGLDLGILTFGSTVSLAREMNPVRQVSLPARWSAGGTAPIGKAVARSLKVLEAQEAHYRKNGLHFQPSCLVILGRGSADDAWQPVARTCRALDLQRKISVIAAGLGTDVDLSVLGQFCEARPVLLANLGMPAFLEAVRSGIAGEGRSVSTGAASRFASLPERAISPTETTTPLDSQGAPAILARAIADTDASHPSPSRHSAGTPLVICGAAAAFPDLGPQSRSLTPRRYRALRKGWHEVCSRLGLKRRLTVRPRKSATTAEPILSPALPPQRLWFGAADSCVGAAHLRHEPPTPCQDAALVVTGPFPMLVVADGAGSSPLSDMGAEAVVVGLRRLVDTLSRHFRTVLDTVDAPPEATARALAHTLVRHACGLIDDLASQHRRPASDFRSTLLVCVAGRSHWLWARVGDGALIVEKNRTLRLLGEAGKGEFANQTVFLGRDLHPEQIQWGVESAEGLSGVAAMTDGAAERLVSTDGMRISSQIGTFFREAREEKLTRSALRLFFQERDVWRSSSGDDRGLAVLACQDAAG